MRETTSTVSQAVSQPDSEGTLRAELLGTLIAAERELSAQLNELTASAADPALIAACRRHLGHLTMTQATVGTTPAAALATLRAEVKATVSAATSLTQQARGAITANDMSEALSATTAALRNELATAHSNLFEKRVFDPFLSFASDEDKEAYRQREEETRRYIAKQMAAGTPEGTLNASGATMGQMLDAHAHGAGRSPEFMPQWNRLVETTERHRAAMRAEGRSTQEYDRNLTTSIRRYLKDKGLTEAQIDAALAASSNPLDAVKLYLKDDGEAMTLERSAQIADGRATSTMELTTVAVPVPANAAAPGSPVTVNAPDLDDVMAVFQAAGIKAGQQPEVGESPALQTVGKKLPATGLSGPG